MVFVLLARVAEVWVVVVVVEISYTEGAGGEERWCC